MADTVKCLVCGEVNSKDQEFCQYCQSRLRPLTGPLRGADVPLVPGEAPTKKVTAELEPILPKWLREARDKARSQAEVDAVQALQEQAASSKSESEPDLLAGLKSQARAEEDDETPDWLAKITGATPTRRKSGMDASEARWVEVGGSDDFVKEPSKPDEETPSWLAGQQTDSQDAGSDELKDWFRQSTGEGLPAEQPPLSEPLPWANQPPPEVGAPTWDQPASSSFGTDMPDWLKQMSAEGEAEAPSSGVEVPWSDPDTSQVSPDMDLPQRAGGMLDGFDAESASMGEVPAWLQGFDSQPEADAAGAGQDLLQGDHPLEAAPPRRGTTPLWLREKGELGSNQEAEVPEWLSDAPAAEPPPAIPQTPIPQAPIPESPISTPQPAEPFELPGTQAESSGEAVFGDIPDWLKAAAPQSSIYAESPIEETSDAPPEASGWLATFRSSPPPEPSEEIPQEQSDMQAPPPAFTSDAFKDGSADGLFTEMPDWLSNVAEPAAGAGPAPAEDAGELIPGDLPSWVKAMRPVDTGVSKAPPLASSGTLETRGALSGLQGVLPAVPGFTPTSKPRPQSIKLQATQEQQSHAALLEHILAAETEPVPITSFTPLRRSRSLRWIISVVILFLVLVVTSSRTSLFSMPVDVPLEMNAALQVAQNVPQGAPVLVAIDYHPARAAEMEAAAAPLFDQMDILRQSRWIFVSTNETGPILAERFITGHIDHTGPLDKPHYQYGTNYVNLGYLPGGVMGIRAFTLNPIQAMPFDILLNLAWEMPPLQGIASLSQFAALIVITDSVDSARAWVEQTVSLREAAPLPLVVISSAQAAPMIEPYYQAGQVDGMITGLYGGAIFETNNAGRPGTARAYWDAYSLGMLLAMVFILGGGSWSAFMTLRERASSGEKS